MFVAVTTRTIWIRVFERDGADLYKKLARSISPIVVVVFYDCCLVSNRLAQVLKVVVVYTTTIAHRRQVDPA